MVVRTVAAFTPTPARTAESNRQDAGEGGDRTTAGNGRPPSGSLLPPGRRGAADGLADAAARLQQLVREANRDLEFHVDDSSGRTVITVTSEATGEVVRQIPADEVLALARAVRGFGTIVDSEV